MASAYPGVTEELLSAAIDGELSAVERAAVEAALADNPALRAEYRALQATKSAVRRAFAAAALPAELSGRLRAALDDADQAAARRRAPFPVRRRAVVALAAAAILVLAIAPLRRRPDDPEWSFSPQQLAQVHVYWQDHFAKEPVPLLPADEMARRLQREVGYLVRPPDVDALQARLVACTSCDHSFPSGRKTALFVMRRSSGEDLTLFEVEAPQERVDLCQFQPVDGTGALGAEADGIHLAVWSHGSSHTCLASTLTSTDELARLAPHAVRLAAEARPRLVSLAR